MIVTTTPSVEGRPVHNKVFDDREAGRTPWFHRDSVTLVEPAHMKLTGGDTLIRPVWMSVDV